MQTCDFDDPSGSGKGRAPASSLSGVAGVSPLSQRNSAACGIPCLSKLGRPEASFNGNGPPGSPLSAIWRRRPLFFEANPALGAVVPHRRRIGPFGSGTSVGLPSLFDRRHSFHAEFIANAEAEEEEQNGAEDGLNGGQDFEHGGKIVNAVGIKKILAETEHVERIGEAQSEGLVR